MEQTCAITEKQINDFKIYLMEEERSKATIEKYERDVRKFMGFLGDSMLTKEIVLEYKNELLKEYNAASINSMLVALNRFLQHLGLENYTVKQLKIQKANIREEEKELTETEYKQLVKMAYEQGNSRLALIMETICSTGIRISELKYFTVKSLKEGKAEIHNKGKTRTIILPDTLKKKILCYVGKNGITTGSIFITRGGKPVDRSNIWREMKKLGVDVKVLEKKIYPHNLRHLFARIYYQMFKDVLGLADILGHSSSETTRIYTMTTSREYRRRMEHLQLTI